MLNSVVGTQDTCAHVMLLRVLLADASKGNFLQCAKKNKIILSHSLVAYFFLALATTPESDDVRLSQCFHPGAALGLWSQHSRCCVFRLLCFLPVPVLSFLCCVAGCGSIRLLKLTRLHPAEIVLCF